MKGLMLLFMLFGLGVSLSDNSNGVMQKEDYVPAIEQPETVQEPVIEEPATDDDEYCRSVGDVAVSRDAFSEDKEKILSISAN